MRAKGSRWIAAAVLALALAGGLAFWARPQPPHPVTPVPPLAQPADAGFTARLVPPQTGLTALPATVEGRAAQAPPDGLRHEWPGQHAGARFEGRAISLRFDDARNRWRIVLDGAEIEVSRPGRQDLRIEGLPPGPHEIRAEKISESWEPAVFGGFLLDAGDGKPLPPPAPAGRLIEFIGDSDTVGLAGTAERRDCSDEEIYSATDTSRSYAARAAQALGADYRIVARSGIGLLRNYGGVDPGRVMPALYPLALPGDPAAMALPARKADIVVVALGSNDFGSDFLPGEPWQDKAALADAFGPALADFSRQRATENPGAMIVLLAFGEYGEELVGAYRHAAQALTDSGIGNRLVVVGNPDRNACLWHPSATDHAMIAKTLVDGLGE